MKNILLFSCLYLLTVFGYSQADDQSEAAYIEAKTSSGTLITVPLETVSADVHITGFIAHVTTKQVYTNPTDDVLHATYVFPGSTRAAVHGMTMEIDGRTIEAQVQEKQQALETFEQAKKEGKSASLLQQHRPNVFQMDIGNIQPNTPITITLRYSEILKPVEGIYEFVYPTIVGERYDQEVESGESWTLNPYTHLDQDNEVEITLPSFDIQVHVDSPIPMQGLNVPSHKSSISYHNEKSATIKLDNGGHSENKDFIVRYRLESDRIETGITLYEGEKENFFLYVGQAPEKVKRSSVIPREYFFIIDVSGSMNGFPLNLSKRVMNRILESIGPENKFNVLLFAASSQVFAPEAVPASRDNIDRALRFINETEGGGGTQMLGALRHAFEMIDPASSTSIIILTDGFVTVEREAFKFIDENLGRANFFPVGIGSSVNRHLIEGMAHVGHSEPFIVTNREQAGSFGTRFFEYVAHPILTNVTVDFKGLKTYDVLPTNLPDLFVEKPVVVYGKWKGNPKGKAVLRGSTGQDRYEKITEITSANVSGESPELKYLWARKKLQLLSDYNFMFRSEELRQEITEVGLTYSLLSEYTSFVAIDEQQKIAEENTVVNHANSPGAVPEPHEWALILVGALLIGWFFIKQYV